MRLRALAYARPGYGEAVQDAFQGRAEMFTRFTPPSWGRLSSCGPPYSHPLVSGILSVYRVALWYDC